MKCAEWPKNIQPQTNIINKQQNITLMTNHLFYLQRKIVGRGIQYYISNVQYAF